MRDPYSVLGVAKSADASAIKSAYRKLAKTHHPDQNPDDPRAKERFAEISSAYDILGDTTKRRAFDRGEIDADGHPTMAGFNPFSGAGSRAQGGANPGFEDLFATFTQGRGAGYRSSRFSSGFGGESPDDVLRSMFGDGGPGHAGGRRAGAGGGTEGRTSEGVPLRGDDVKVLVKVSLEEILAGEKVTVGLPGQQKVKVALPKGLDASQTVRLKGKGHRSAAGGAPGDALVTFSVAAHPRFKLDGANVLLDLPVTLDEAVLGTRIPVETLDGTVALTLPAGTQSGQVMRLKEKGLPSKKGTRADLLVKVLIKLPDGGDDGLSTLMKRWRTDGRYTVR